MNKQKIQRSSVQSEDHSSQSKELSSISKRKRNSELDLLKFIFSLLIVFFHSFVFRDAKNFSLFSYGYISVEYFFLISGALMAGSAKSFYPCENNMIGAETTKFLFKKIKRFFPTVIIAYAIAFIIRHIGSVIQFKAIMIELFYSIWELSFLRMSGINGIWYLNQIWYISAMLMAMLILYPLLRQHRDIFIHIIAPLITIFVLGYLSTNFGSMSVSDAWLGFTYTGVLRAFMGLSLGCICYSMSLIIKKSNWSLSGKILLSILEMLGYAAVIIGSNFLGGAFDFFYEAILAFCLTITLSEEGILFSLLNKFDFSRLARFSFILFLNHHCILFFLPLTTAALNYWEKLVLYLASSVVLSIVAWWAENFLLKAANFTKRSLYNILTKETLADTK